MNPPLSDTYIWTVIVGMAILNFAVRFVPIAIVSRVDLPRPLMRWLSFIPVSVMGALVTLEVLRPEGNFVDPISSPYTWAALATALAYWKSRSFLGATLVGLVSFVAFKALLG